MDEPSSITSIVEAVGTGGTFVLALAYLVVRYLVPALKARNGRGEASESTDAPGSRKLPEDLVRQVDLTTLGEAIRGDYTEVADKLDRMLDRQERMAQDVAVLKDRRP